MLGSFNMGEKCIQLALLASFAISRAPLDEKETGPLSGSNQHGHPHRRASRVDRLPLLLFGNRK